MITYKNTSVRFFLATLVLGVVTLTATLASADDTAPVHMAPTVHHASHAHVMPILVSCHAVPLSLGKAGDTVQVCVAVQP